MTATSPKTSMATCARFLYRTSHLPFSIKADCQALLFDLDLLRAPWITQQPERSSHRIAWPLLSAEGRLSPSFHMGIEYTRLNMTRAFDLDKDSVQPSFGESVGK